MLCSICSCQDPATAEALSNTLKDLRYMSRSGRKPTTVLCVTHTLERIEMFSHVIFLVDGRIAEYGTKEELMARRGHFYRRVQQQRGVRMDARGRAIISPDRVSGMWLFSGAPWESLVNLADSFAMRVLSEGEELFPGEEEVTAMGRSRV